MYKSITNNYDIGKKRPKLACRQQIIFEPTEEWNYAHHPGIAYFKGRYFVSFSSGRNHEDDAGQRFMYAVSDDFEDWSPARLLQDAPDPAHDVLSPGGFWVDGDRIIAFYSMFSYKDEALKNGSRRPGSAGRIRRGCFYKVSTDGDNWSEPVSLGDTYIHGNIIRLKSGRLLSVGGNNCAWNDTSDVLSGWKTSLIYPDGYPKGNDSADSSEGVFADTPAGLVSDTNVALCEGDAIQAKGGTLYMYLRSGTPYLWVSESHDEGETWSLPEPTRFTDNRTKFDLGQLPDGRYYYVGTPDPFPPRTRHTLVLSISEDGLNWKHHYLLADAQYKGRYPGIDKNGVYGYPAALIRDGYMHVAFSINKEKLAVLRVACDTL